MPELTILLTDLALVGAGAGLLSAVWVLRNPVEGRLSDRLLSLLLLLGVLNTLHPLLGLRHNGEGPQVIEPLQYLLPIGVLWYLRSLTGRVFRVRDGLALLLPLGFLVISFFPLGPDPTEALRYVSVVMWITMGVFSMTLLFPAAAEIARYRKGLQSVYSNLKDVDPSWLGTLLGALGLLFLIYALLTFLILHAPGFPVNQTLAGLMAALTVWLGWKALGRRRKLSWDEPAPAPVPEQALVQWAQLIRQRLVERRLFLNPDLTLDDVAQMAGLSRHETSAARNRGLGASFFDVVNGLRVAEFQRLCSLPGKKDDKILTLALESGFNSKPAFNQIFKKTTGSTPSEYRRTAAIGS